MRTLGVMAVAGLLAFTAAAAPAGDKKVVELEEGRKLLLPQNKHSVRAPLLIRKADDLKQLEGSKELHDLVQKKVDFGKSYAVVFRWAGSGGDKLNFTTPAADNVAF